jgi:hypothetical protein
MGLVQEVRAAVTGYENAARSTILAAHDLATTVAGLGERLAAHGPLGASTDPDIARARAQLATARQRLLAAAEAAEASRAQARTFADRLFPV